MHVIHCNTKSVVLVFLSVSVCFSLCDSSLIFAEQFELVSNNLVLVLIFSQIPL